MKPNSHSNVIFAFTQLYCYPSGLCGLMIFPDNCRSTQDSFCLTGYELQCCFPSKLCKYVVSICISSLTFILSIPAKICPCCGILLHLLQTLPCPPTPCQKCHCSEIYFVIFVSPFLTFCIIFSPCNSSCSGSLSLVSNYKLTGFLFLCCKIKITTW